jgi:hypothetical protein
MGYHGVSTGRERETPMETAIILRGRIADPHHIELDEPVEGLTGTVEVMLRAVGTSPDVAVQDVFDLIASLTPGSRSKDEIDRQIADERASWGER